LVGEQGGCKWEEKKKLLHHTKIDRTKNGTGHKEMKKKKKLGKVLNLRDRGGRKTKKGVKL